MIRPLATAMIVLMAAWGFVEVNSVDSSDATDQRAGRGSGRVGSGGSDLSGRPPPWPEEARLFGSDQMQFWSFSRDVALDGDTAVVGASGADIGGNVDQGAAYVFVRQDDEWAQQAQLVAGDGASNDWFGWSVAIDGDTVAVGARLADIGNEISEGAVYVFERSGDEWREVQKLLASDGDELDCLGSSVALDGDTLVAGAVSEEGAIQEAIQGCQGSGAAYVFIGQGGAWVEQVKLFDPEGQCSDGFGNDVALQGDTALIGADSAFVEGEDRGAAYVYIRIADTWSLEQKLLASDGDQPDMFGQSVALDRDTALIGAEQKDIDGNQRQGAAYIFRRSGTTWTEEQRLTASDGHAEGSFGIGAALRDGVALVGAEFDFPGEPERGVVYEFRDQGGIWVEIQKFAAPEGNLLDSFGRAIALTADHVLISHKDEIVLPPPGGSAWIFGRPTLFQDGFESGDPSAWNQTVP